MPINYNYEGKISAESKMRQPDRILKLEIIDGTKPKTSLGMTDESLFKDGDTANRLHGIMDMETCLWRMKYERGALPPVLQGQFTSFKKLKEHAEQYFIKRNVRISEVID